MPWQVICKVSTFSKYKRGTFVAVFSSHEILKCSAFWLLALICSAWVREASPGVDQRKSEQCFFLNLPLLHFPLLYGARNHKMKRNKGIPLPQAKSPPIPSAEFYVFIRPACQSARLASRGCHAASCNEFQTVSAKAHTHSLHQQLCGARIAVINFREAIEFRGTTCGT